MTPNIILIGLLVPITLLVIAVVKSGDLWRVKLATLPRCAQAAVLLIAALTVIYGGEKPGPTKANLRLLIAERASGKLSSGAAYGSKSATVAAGESAGAAVVAVASAAVTIGDASAAVASSGTNALEVAEASRYYIRLTSPSPVVTNHTLYAEITGIVVSNGVGKAGVWFNVVPNSEPVMRFNFASESATNLWFTAIPSASSFPDTYACGGFDCYLYTFAVPPVLLDAAGNLLAPLAWEKRVAFGSPATAEPLDIKGGLALYAAGEFYVAVSGYRTNALGQAFYFDNGRIANPPMQTSGAPVE